MAALGSEPLSSELQRSGCLRSASSSCCGSILARWCVLPSRVPTPSLVKRCTRLKRVLPRGRAFAVEAFVAGAPRTPVCYSKWLPPKAARLPGAESTCRCAAAWRATLSSAEGLSSRRAVCLRCAGVQGYPVCHCLLHPRPRQRPLRALRRSRAMRSECVSKAVECCHGNRCEPMIFG